MDKKNKFAKLSDDDLDAVTGGTGQVQENMKAIEGMVNGSYSEEEVEEWNKVMKEFEQ